MKKRESKELLAEMYADEKGTMLNLFCFNLISADVLTDKEACESRLEKLKKFEAFLEEQEESEKKAYYQKFVKDARQIIERDMKGFMEEEIIGWTEIRDWKMRSYWRRNTCVKE